MDLFPFRNIYSPAWLVRGTGSRNGSPLRVVLRETGFKDDILDSGQGHLHVFATVSEAVAFRERTPPFALDSWRNRNLRYGYTDALAYAWPRWRRHVTGPVITPLVPPRNRKPRHHVLEDQASAELDSSELPRSHRISTLTRKGMVARKLFGFVRTRATKPQPPAQLTFATRLTFERFVTGPIALVHGSHYGFVLVAAEDIARNSS